ncbi:MAG: hypothetical protein PHI90_07595 [Clostridia bacterium]|nr:hypothetical protein [Clostridia bacterium]
MRSILIFYEHISREYETCMRIKESLEKTPNIKVYVFSLHFQVLEALWRAKRNYIEMVIVPYAYKENSLKPISYLLRKSPIPYVINLHHEQIGAVYNEERLFPIDEISKNRVIHFVWSNHFKEKLISRGVNEELIKVTGSIRTDLVKHAFQKDKSTFSKEFNLNVDKKWILLCESGTTPYTEIEMKKKEKQGLKRSDIIEYNKSISLAYLENIRQNK